MKKYFLILTVFIIALVTSACSCALNRSTLSKPDVYKLNQKASEYMALGDYDSAIARLTSINDLDPNHPEVYYNLGIAYLKKEDFPKAVAALNNAVTLKPDFSEAYYSLGVAYESWCDKQISELGATKDIAAKTQLRAQITQNIQNIYRSYQAFLEKAPEGAEKQEVQGQLNYLGEKYKDFAISNNAAFRE